MRKAVIFIADSNNLGPGHKLILPSIRYVYIKQNIECTIIDPYRDGYDPTMTTLMGNSTLTQYYKHAIKTATDIHFITSAHLGGINPILEGVFEHVLINGFAYNRKTNKRQKGFKKPANFYVVYNHKVSKLNAIWFRLKFILQSKVFKGGIINQYMPDDFLDKKKITESIKKQLS